MASTTESDSSTETSVDDEESEDEYETDSSCAEELVTVELSLALAGLHVEPEVEEKCSTA